MSLLFPSPPQLEALSLLRRRVHARSLSSSAVVYCASGRLWVTAPGSDDVILERGESAKFSGPGRLVIEALADAEFTLANTSPMPAPFSG